MKFHLKSKIIAIQGFSILFILALGMGLKAQVGLGVSYLSNNASDWQTIVDPQDQSNFPGSGMGVQLDYWFRIKDKRIEFLPEINYKSFKEDDLGSSVDEYKSTFYGFQLNVNIYFLDFAGDCNCPTFSKRGNMLEKGLYFQIAPGYSFANQSQVVDAVSEETNSSGFYASAGMGIDFGISDFFTITPFVRGVYYPKMEWENLRSSLDGMAVTNVSDTESDILQLQMGIRLGLRFDELR